MTAFVHEGRRAYVVLFAVFAMIAALLAIPATPANAVATDACPATIPSAGFTDLGGFSVDVVDAANCLAFYDITKGTSATTYGPSANVSRWQMALFLTRQAVDHGVTLPSGADQGFTDLTGLSAEAVTAINQLAQLNITKGTSATTFDPNGNVARWQMALFITRLVTGAGITLPSGADQGFTDISGLAAETQTAINQTAQLAISKGTSATTFDPTGNVTRAQMALFLTRTLEAGGVTPPVAELPSDAPQLVSVTFDEDDDDNTRLIYKFDEDVSIVDEDFFLLYDVTGTAYTAIADGVDKGADDEVEVIFDNDHVDVATVAAVASGAVENIDGDINPADSVGYEAYTLNGFDLPDFDLPELVGVDDFDNDDDTVVLEFDQSMDPLLVVTTINENAILFVEEGGNVWRGVAGSADVDTDDNEFVTIKLEDESDLSAPSQSDYDDLVRVFLEPNAVIDDTEGNPPHSLDLSLSGETDDTPSLESVDVDVVGKEVTFNFNRSIVDANDNGGFVAGEFVLASVAADGSMVLEQSVTGDLDRDDPTTVIWDLDGLGSWRSLIVYAGIWDPSGTSAIEDFSTNNLLEVGHFVNVTYTFSAGTTAAPALVSSAGSATGLAGTEYEIELEWSQDLDDGTVTQGELLLFEDGGADIAPTFTVDSPDVDDEMVTLILDENDDGFDELDDGDVAVFSFDEDFAVSPFGYGSVPTSIGCGC